VVKDALMASPFAPAEPQMFFYYRRQDYVLYRLSPRKKTSDALVQLTACSISKSCLSIIIIATKLCGEIGQEVLIGKLRIFAGLAIFIPVWGLFGLAPMCGQRTGRLESGRCWGFCSAALDVVSKIYATGLISCLIASPLAFYFYRVVAEV